MIEVDRWLKENAALLGINPDNANPHSVDICLGGHIIVFDQWGQKVEELQLEDGAAFTFRPGHFYLCHTAETVHVPETHTAQLWLKSSTARKGLNHLLAGYVDAGWTGQLTLEFVAYMPAAFTIGQRIAQLQYSRLAAVPEKPYSVTGRYQGGKGAVESKG